MLLRIGCVRFLTVAARIRHSFLVIVFMRRFLARWRLSQQGDAGRESVNEVLSADGAELTAAEEAGGRDIAEQLMNDPNVMVRLAPHVRAAAVAPEEHGSFVPARLARKSSSALSASRT
jgi:hypothetical protein